VQVNKRPLSDIGRIAANGWLWQEAGTPGAPGKGNNRPEAVIGVPRKQAFTFDGFSFAELVLCVLVAGTSFVKLLRDKLLDVRWRGDHNPH
jgi:hypothetical protein